jgi:hypothetical protein
MWYQILSGTAGCRRLLPIGIAAGTEAYAIAAVAASEVVSD